MRDSVHTPGFSPLPDRPLGRERRGVAVAELLASIGIALCTLIAGMVVTVGIARADVASQIIDQEGSLFAIALMLGLVFAALGGLSLIGPFARDPIDRRHLR